MFGIGRKIKKDFFGYLLRYLKNNFSEKIYSFFVFLSIFKKFKREINKNLRIQSDEGKPVCIVDSNDDIANVFSSIAQAVHKKLTN